MMENKRYELMFGDCLERMTDIPDGSVDMVMCDLPYGTTACKWDVVIPFAPLWAEYRRVCKKNAAIVLTASQPFTSALVMSNVKAFRYCWVWEKTNVSNPQLAKKQPLKTHEDVLVFSFASHNYDPQGLVACVKERKKDAGSLGHCTRKAYTQTATNYPKSIIRVPSERGLHPTQKPVALMEYLIRTYTNEGDIVLDNCMGSGTTGVACAKTGRRFIGIERDETYFTNASERVIDAYAEVKPVETPIL